MSLKQPVCIGCDDQAIDHAACLLGGARDRGTCPRLNVSMISIVPPQQGHGSRNVSDAGSLAWRGSCSGALAPIRHVKLIRAQLLTRGSIWGMARTRRKIVDRPDIARWEFCPRPRMRISSIIHSQSGVGLSLTGTSCCLSIEKPQSSNRPAGSQNPQACQIQNDTSQKHQCRASGFVLESFLD
jgi:hypothetical protein